MTIIEQFLDQLSKKNLDPGDISSTLRSLINHDQTILDNLSELIAKFNAENPDRQVPQDIVGFLVSEVSRIKTETHSSSVDISLNQPFTSGYEATQILNPEIGVKSGAAKGEGTGGRAEDFVSKKSNKVAHTTGPTSSSMDPSQYSASDKINIKSAKTEEYDVDVGSVLSNRYHMVEKLGEGGMGLVFKAKDELMAMAEDRNPYVAVKVLTKAFRQRRDAFIALQRETSKAQKLAHPNICTVFHFDKDGDTIFMTMELLKGTDLRDYINTHIKKPRKPFTMEKAWPLISGIAEALRYAHKNNLIHSDLKPGNVFVIHDKKTGQQTVKVIDFGIAQAVNPRETSSDGDSGDITKFDPKKLGALTPSYATLEMFSGMSPIQSDDIYALGCISYELLTGQRPYGSFNAKKAQMAEITQPTVSVKNLGLTRRQVKGLIKSVQLKRKNRTKTIDEFIDAVAPRKSYLWPIVASVTLILAVIGALSVPIVQRYFQDSVNAAVTLKLQDPDFVTFFTGLDELLAYQNEEERAKVSNTNREFIQNSINNISLRYFNPDEGVYNYREALKYTEKGLALFPDSNNLQGLKRMLANMLNQENSRLGSTLAQGLEDSNLLGEGEPLGVVKVLQRARFMDSENTLLLDPTLRFVFEDEIGKSIQSEDFEKAVTLIEHAKVLIADAGTMPTYSSDDLSIALSADQYAQTIEEASGSLIKANDLDLARQIQAGVASLMSTMRLLAPTDQSLRRLANNNDRRFNQESLELTNIQLEAHFAKYNSLLTLDNLYRQRLNYLSNRFQSTPSSKPAGELGAGASGQAGSNELSTALSRLRVRSGDLRVMLELDLLSRRLISEASAVTRLEELLNKMSLDFGALLDNLLEQNRYALASVTLTRMSVLLPENFASGINSYINRISNERRMFYEQQQRNRSLARIESIRQNLIRQIDARNLMEAKKFETQLRGLLDPEDVFLQLELPVLYADAYYDLSIQAIESDNVREAKTLFRNLSKYTNESDKRYIRVGNLIKGEDLKAKLIAQIKRANVIYEQDMRQKINELIRLNVWNFDDFVDKLISTIITRALRLAERSTERALIMIDNARLVFPNSQELKDFDLSLELPSEEVEDTTPETSSLSEEAMRALKEAESTDAVQDDKGLRLKNLIASVESNLRQRKLNETYRIIQSANQEFPQEKRINALEKAYRTERSKAEELYRQHNSAVLRGDFKNAARLIRDAVSYWKDNDEFKSAALNLSKIQKQVLAGARICSDNLSGKGRNPRAFCHDMVLGKFGPRLIIIPGDKGLRSSFVISRHEISVGEYNYFCKKSRKCGPVRGNPKKPITNIGVKQMNAYANWLSRNTLYTYRLPTLDEWMYATTANNQEDNDDYNCTLFVSGQQVKGHEVQFTTAGASNRWGLINYVGNVDEVVSAGADKYLLKGGNHKDAMFQCNTGFEKKYDGSNNELVGFRLVRTLH